jgi:hypothetical protein
MRAVLRRHIDDLAVEVGAPSFEPHVTLASGIADDRAVNEALGAVATTHAPIELAAGATAHGVERFKALFVELADERIHDLARTLCAALGLPFDDSTLAPHLSLLYRGDLPLPTRQDLASRHSLAGTTIRFDTLIAMRPGEGIDDVARWQTIVARALRGPP